MLILIFQCVVCIKKSCRSTPISTCFARSKDRVFFKQVLFLTNFQEGAFIFTILFDNFYESLNLPFIWKGGGTLKNDPIGFILKLAHRSQKYLCQIQLRQLNSFAMKSTCRWTQLVRLPYRYRSHLYTLRVVHLDFFPKLCTWKAGPAGYKNSYKKSSLSDNRQS